MPELLDHVAYLSQEVGPRPAGTEEEQQAALYITEQIQKEAGLSTVIEDFNGAPDADIPRIICCVCSIVFAVLSLFLPVLGVASIVVTLLVALLFAAEVFDRPLLSKAFSRGVSQNVVAKYDPGYSAEAGGSRRRKVIVVAHYDSGKVQSELRPPFVGILHILQWISFGAVVLLPALLVVRNVIFLNVGGAVALVLNILVIIAVVLVAIPLLLALLHKLAPYNEGANCNASGTAVLMEVARRVGLGRISETELAAREEAVVHGEQAAREAGLVPEGAELMYETEGPRPPEPAPQAPEARLAAAKAAVAMLSGKPVSNAHTSDIAENLVQVKDQPLAPPTDAALREQRDETREALSSLPPDTMQEALINAEDVAYPQVEGGDVALDTEDVAEEVSMNEAVASDEATETHSSTIVGASVEAPDWFKKAQEKAKKPHDDKPVQRSRYAAVLDAVSSENDDHFAEVNEVVEQHPKENVVADRDGAQEMKAPQWSSAPTSTFASAPRWSTTPKPTAAPVSESKPAPESTPAPTPMTIPAPTESVPLDPSSTTAMSPIDVSSLNLDTPPAAPVVSEASVSTSKPVPTTTAPTTSVPAPVSTPQTIQEDAGNEEPVSTVAPARRPIVLPDIGIASSKPAPLAEIQKQRAPLADVEESGKTVAKSLLTMLPSINLDEVKSDTEAGEGQAAGLRTGSVITERPVLRATQLSPSGAIGRADTSGARTSVSMAGSFAPAGATGAFAPVGDELLNNVDPDDIYVDDADDSAYDENLTETGAFAGPGYVEMPKSRVHRLFDRFRRKDGEEEPTPQEWLDVDDSFDARTVGEERGGWESFRGDEDSLQDTSAATHMSGYAGDYDGGRIDYNDYDDGFAKGEAAGDVNACYADPRQISGNDAFDPNDVDDADGFDDFSDGKHRPWHGGAFSSRRREMVEDDFDDLAVEDGAPSPSADVPDELQQIYQFRNPDINTEVWFVALGSELAQNGGMRAFLTEHQQDLRGSIIIELDALGAGDLCVIEREGMYRTAKAPSRMKRYVKKASQATGISVGGSRILWGDSASSFAIKHGYQALHLAGMDGAKQALFGQGDDVLENIDEEMLTASADYVMELLKNI